MEISMQQQTVVSQVAEAEQEVEQEVQLTELLPVNQSRIAEDISEDTDGTTDALKVLRSLPTDDNDESFELKGFEFSTESVDETLERQDANRKRTHDGEKRDDAEEEDAINKDDNPKRVRRARNTGVGRAAKRHKRSNKRNDDDETRTERGIAGRRRKSTSANEEERIVAGENFGGRRARAPGTTGTVAASRESPNDSSTATGEIPVTRRRRNKDGKPRSWNAKRIGTSANDENSELRRKIDDIIQLNKLLNNNEDEFKGEDASSPSLPPGENDAVSVEPAANGSGNSGNTNAVADDEEEEEPKKRVRKKYKQHYCQECGQYIKGMPDLSTHRKDMHSPGRFKCDNCGEEFRSKERMKRHVLAHMYKRRVQTRSRGYGCKRCPMTFDTPCQLVVHKRTHQPIRRVEKLECDICGTTFSRRDSLQKHKSFFHHGDFKSLICEICHRTYKGHLSQHMRTHAKERPYGCGDCGQRFAQKSQLTVHQRTHSGQRPFRCMVCWQAFAHSTALKLHTRRHTGERPFKCAECNAGFTQLPHWKKHMKCVHGKQNPYGCKHCGSSFKMRCEYDRHRSVCELRMRADEENNADDVTAEKQSSSAGSFQHEIIERYSNLRYKMSIEKMRLLLAALLKRISKQERLDELGFGKRLIDDVLHDSLASAGKEPVTRDGLSELDALSRNVEIFLEWTVPKEHWKKFREMKKSTVDILEALTSN